VTAKLPFGFARSKRLTAPWNASWHEGTPDARAHCHEQVACSVAGRPAALPQSLRFLANAVVFCMGFADESFPPIQEAEGRRSRRSVQRSLGMWQVVHPRVQSRLVRSTARWLQKMRPATQLLIGLVFFSCIRLWWSLVPRRRRRCASTNQRRLLQAWRRRSQRSSRVTPLPAFRIVSRRGAQPRRKSPLCMRLTHAGVEEVDSLRVSPAADLCLRWETGFWQAFEGANARAWVDDPTHIHQRKVPCFFFLSSDAEQRRSKIEPFKKPSVVALTRDDRARKVAVH